MTREEKDLLLKDICSRLLYYTKVYNNHADGNWSILTPVLISNIMNIREDNDLVIKPYLFPLSSMTEEHKKELENILGSTPSFDNMNKLFYDMWGESKVYLSGILRAIEFFNKHHYDYNGLIPKGLAIDCTNLSELYE